MGFLIPGSVTKYKDLFIQLTLREIKARYKQSILGYAWAILVPLINLVVLTIVFSRLFKVPTGNIPYPVFLFVALIPWTLLSNSLSLATGSVLANSSLVTKVSLPREILPLTSIAARLVDFFLTSIVLVIFLIAFGVHFYPTFFLVPFILIVQLMLLTGIAFFLSATNVFFRDVENILGVFLTVWMYLTPVVYSPALIPENLRILFYLNPMMGIINAFRSVILDGTLPAFDTFIYSVMFSLTSLVLGYSYFKNRSKYFADVL